VGLLYVASAKVGPGDNWRSFLGESQGSLGGIILHKFGNWSSLTVGSDTFQFTCSLVLHV
jgi:hypothetical protein